MVNILMLIWIGSVIGTAILCGQKNLSTGLWLVLSLFFGPLIFIIVLALPPAKSVTENKGTRIKDLQSLKDELARLKNYIANLEEKIARFEKEPLPAPEPEIIPKTEPQKEAPIKEEEKIKPSPTAAKDSDFEVKLGRYWLSKIGSIILVAGIAFLITYTFRFFHAAARIGCGYAAACLLFWFGLRLEKKAQFKYYGRAILGGAWAILYFTTYAMYHFDISRIIHSQLLDFILLAVIVAGIIIHSLRYRSYTLTAIALFMGYFTATLSDISFFTLAACALLALAAILIIIKTQMTKFIYYGIFFTYTTHLIWVTRNIDFSLITTTALTVNEVIFWMNSIFLALYWLIFNIAIYHPKINTITDKSKNLSLANFFNFLLFFFLEFGLVYKTYPMFKFHFVFGLGIIYCALWLISHKLKNKDFKVADLLIALSLITLSLPLKFSGPHTAIIWLFELPIVVYLGVILNKRYLKWFGTVLAIFISFKFIFLTYVFSGKIIMFGKAFLWKDIIALIGLVSMYGCYSLYETKRINKSREIGRGAGNLYSFLGTIYLGIFVWRIFGAKALSPTLFSEALLLYFVGIMLGDKYFRLYGAVILAGGWFRMLFIDNYLSYDLARWPIICGQAGISYLIYSLSIIKKTKETLLNYERQWAKVIFICTTFILTVIIFRETSHKWISLALGAEGVVLFISGFLFKDKIFRIGGFAVFLILLVRVIFVDIAALETIYKIISFIAIGIIFLAVSFVYTKFNILKQNKNT